MKKTVLIGVAVFAPLTGLALIAGLARAAEPQENPPKSVAPKEPLPKEVAPPAKDAAAAKEAAPSKDAAPPREAAPAKEQPRDVTPRDNPPRANPSKDPRDTAPVPPAKARDDIPNARDSKPRTRAAIPNARDTAPTTRDTIPNARDPRETPRDVARDPKARDSRDATRDARSTVRDTHREHRSTRDLGITFGRVSERGLAVTELAPTSVLVRSGLRSGDVIVSINGHRLERVEDFDRFVFAVNINERIKVVVFRDGREEIVYLEPAVFYVDESFDDDFVNFGVVFDDRYPDRLIVVRVYPDSPAFLAGLRVGDEIVTWHGQRVASARDFGRLIHRIEPGVVDFEFARGSKTMRAEAKFSERVATKPSTQEAPPPDARDPSANPEPAPAPAPAPPSVRPMPPAAPGPAPAPITPAPPPRRPGLIRGR